MTFVEAEKQLNDDTLRASNMQDAVRGVDSRTLV